MSNKSYRDKKLQQEILRYLDSFPDGCVKYKIFKENFITKNENVLGFNLNELQHDFGFIKLPPAADLSICITPRGKAEINSKKNFFISHWKWIITTIVAIIAIIIAYFT